MNTIRPRVIRGRLAPRRLCADTGAFVQARNPSRPIQVRDRATAPHQPTTSPAVALDEVEAVARIGSYSTDLVGDRWVSSTGLDAIFGIDATFERTVEGWASIVHPADRDALVAYFTDDVLGRACPFE
jgi:hypothetical protein